MTYKKVYFDNAASSFPKPYPVRHAVARQLRENGANPGRSGHFLSREAAKTLYECRETAADLFRVKPENVVFTSGATEAVNLLLFGLLKAGDRVLISDREHNAVLRPLCALRERGVTFEVVKTDGRPDAEAFADALKTPARLVFCTHASNVTGRIFDIASIARIARARGALTAADVSQTAGIIPTDGLGADFLCVPGHKGLLGPQGCGMLVTKSDVTLTPLLYGGNGVSSLEEDMGTAMPERLEAGTSALPAISGMAAGIRYLEQNGKKRREKEADLTRRALDVLLSDSRVTVYEPDAERVPVIAFNLNGRHSEEVTEALSRHGICVRGGYHCARLTHLSLGTEETGAVRLSFSAFNSAREIAFFKKILKII